MSGEIVARGQELVRAAQLEGVLITIGEAIRAIREYGPTVNQALQWVVDRASQERVPGTIRPRAIANLDPNWRDVDMGGPSDGGHKRPRTTNNEVAPVGENLTGRVVQIGDKPIYTKNYARSIVASCGGLRRSAMSLLMRSQLRNMLFRWQTMRSFSQANEHQDRRSLLLDCMAQRKDDVEGSDVENLYLPMYAFDIGTLPVQAASTVATKTGYVYETVPMYRLMKHCSNLTGTIFGDQASLRGDVQNYYWVPQSGLNNGPSQPFIGHSNWLWNIEKTNMPPGTIHSAKHNYTVVDLLLSCTRTEHCKVHVSLVRFGDELGPNRSQLQDRVFSQTDNGFAVALELRDSAQNSARDVFWESFWDSRVTHPLSDYKPATHKRWLKVISDRVVNINPQEASFTRPYLHKMSFMVKDGSWYDYYDEKQQDNTQGGIAPDAQQPPVVAGGASGNNWHFDYSYGFNQINLDNSVTTKTCDVSPEARGKNVWLLVWMEQSVPSEVMTSINASVDITRPDNLNNYLVENNIEPACCSFDLRVRKQITAFKHD